ncbi:hypothetical protein Ssi03_64430 [Sphaerisporangium siamense]|uniref:Uncharacterized protein n=1 Tax=Sphaerisporangium siamense TaxID=795645 RepID=A0A7W7D4W3_9ACTN|nr:hypothetical protein [Sphaerisporangium siamense]MBB4699018.1 hypothetical protein [Sphaerisporangium siamense]GII88453.1 hypothetical protein Ssi03_64430 [Sphaerisporangium siamense]
MMTAILATGTVLLAAGCGDAPTAADPDQAASSAIVRTSGVTTPGSSPTPATGGAKPTRPKGHTVGTRKVRWESAKPSKDGRRITVVWWSGVEPCHTLDRVRVRETSRRVTITLYEGQAAKARDVACIEIALKKSTIVKLKAPLGAREIVDGARS